MSVRKPYAQLIHKPIVYEQNNDILIAVSLNVLLTRNAGQKEERRRKKKEETTGQKYNGLPYYIGRP